MNMSMKSAYLWHVNIQHIKYKQRGKKVKSQSTKKIMKNWWNHNQLKWSICVIVNSINSKVKKREKNKTKISRNLSSQMQAVKKIEIKKKFCVNRLIVQNKSARNKIKNRL